ncbi:NADPH:quinone reductase [Hoeflea prorocentri]|uniref:NADPH:quinone reductase n=1 Tax=Hoeflea prorocentri TaxID=1922333 RepID=A0A9X3UH60_9HYPH|nr:NADPH:quinone reductase [Hoeflea prorocentri]MCY6381257.1 NADPH:quinone reductase [Hoeflea prorocentri]MDA5399057.1 NADPH:quinone reductase [Hoeflea prorocentri]
MKAIRMHRFGGPEVLQLDEVDDPVPGPGEVVIDVKAAGVNPADTYMRSGTYRVKPDLPCIPGGDAAGIVSAVGAGVEKFAAGDRVFVGTAMGFDFTGCYAEKVKRPQENVLALPDGVSFEQAATFGVSYPTAHYALFERGGAKAGETVFIHGASGSVGTASIQVAKRAGLRVIGSAGSAEGEELVRREGADVVVNHNEDGYLDEVRAATDGGGPDLILEMLANENLAADLDLAAMSGRIMVIGNRGEITINPRLTMMKELDIRGIMLWNATPEQVSVMMTDIMAWIAEGALRPIVGRTFSLADAADAHVAVVGSGNAGKVVLVP